MVNNNLHNRKITEHGGALTSIVIILLILIAGGIYFYKMTKRSVDTNRERATQTQTIPLDANVSGSVQ